MVRRGEIVDLGGAWMRIRGFLRYSKAPGLSFRVRRAAPRIQMQTDEPVDASSGLAKTATLTILRYACTQP